jgi:type I restriction enzyme, S subunit
MIALGRPPKDDRWKQKYKEPAAPDTTSLPVLPEGWHWAGLEQIAFFQNGRPFPSSRYSADGIKLIRPGNLFANGTVRWNDKNTRCLPPEFAEENPDLIVRGSELIMNLTAQSLKDEFLGRICITSDDELALLNQRLARISPVIVAPRFLLLLLKSDLFRRFVDGLNTGSLIQHMFTSQLSEFSVPLPPLPEQNRVLGAVERALSVLDVHEHEMEAVHGRAANLRSAVLSSAFAGKLTPQDPNEEPASVLLERIRAERAEKPKQPVHRRPKELVHA